MSVEHSAAPWIDVTVRMAQGMPIWPGDPSFELTRRFDMDRGDRLTMSAVHMGLHTGTHMDAPSHFIAGAVGIEAWRPEATIGPARVLGIDSDVDVTAADLEPFGIRPGERVLLKTRSSQLWEREGFQPDFIALADDAAALLADRGVACVGVDYLSVGPKGSGEVVHQTLLGAGVWVIEGLDLREVEPGDYDLLCVPLRIVAGEASPVRALLRSR